MSDFLLEIFSEEIPAKMQLQAAKFFSATAVEILTRSGLEIKEDQIKSYVAARRLSLYISSIEPYQIIASSKKIGPAIDASKSAIEGFVRSNNIELANLKTVENNGKICYLLEKSEEKISSAEILQKNLPAILQKMTGSWPKIMRFDTPTGEQAKWIRPIKNILCIFDKKIIDINFCGLKSNNFTYGHFLHSSQPLIINDESQYKNILRDNFVIVDQNERREKIINQIADITKQNLLLTLDNQESALVDEVCGLCEFPTALLAEIDQKFMVIPEEILILTLKSNQKYFCLRDESLNLSTKFIFISNALINENNRKKIIADNEKIVRARLQDAEFVLHEDLKTSLIEKAQNLKNIIFHKDLGSIFERINRIENLAELVAMWIPHCDIALVKRGATLCKADLATKAVAEFPELQGKIGSFYASAQKENAKIVAAINEHYLPLGQSSKTPKTPLGTTLAIADKIDIICGLFLANEKPTSSKDPFALRRMAIGVLRIFFAQNINLPLKILIEKSLKNYKPKLVEKLLQQQSSTKQELITEIIRFFIERLKNFLQEQQKVRKDILNAVIDEYIVNLDHHKYGDIFILAKKSSFLQYLVSDAKYANILKIYKRSANILAIEEKKDGKKYGDRPLIGSLKTQYDKNIYKIIQKISPEFKKLIAKGDFEQSLQLLLLIENFANEFFDNVAINDNNIKTREVRLKLTSMIKSLFDEIVNFSQIEIS